MITNGYRDSPLVVEVSDLSGELGGELRGIEAVDEVDAALTSQQP